MSMLAEKKSKSKWVLNPRGTNAINEMQFGRKMLEKMGWSLGDGLGVEKQGVTEPLRVQYKNDVKGVGYKKNADNEWLKVEDEFSKILHNLSNDTDGNAKCETNIESLEKKSEGSKARLHYHKFTRNKDLSRYSEKDLSCILGFTKSTEEPLDKNEEEDSKFADKGTIDSYFGAKAQKKFINGTSQGFVDEGFVSDSNVSSNNVKKKRRSEIPTDTEISTELEKDSESHVKNFGVGFNGNTQNFDDCLVKAKKKKRKKEALNIECGSGENLNGLAEETEVAPVKILKDSRPEMKLVKFKHKKQELEEVHETEAVMNINVVENCDRILLHKDDKKRKKNKKKKLKNLDLPNFSGSSIDGSADEDKSRKLEFCEDTLVDSGSDEVKKKHKKRKHSELQETEELPVSEQKLCQQGDEELDYFGKLNSVIKKVRFSLAEGDSTTVEPKTTSKKVRFSLAASHETIEASQALTKKVRFSLDESSVLNETESPFVYREDPDCNEPKRKKKSKKHSIDTDVETECNVSKIHDSCQKANSAESVGAINLTDEKVKNKVKKSKKRKHEEVNELKAKIPCQSIDLESTSNCVDDEEKCVTMVTKKSKKRKTELESIDQFEAEISTEIMDKDLVEGEVSLSNEKDKKKVKKSEKRKTKMEEDPDESFKESRKKSKADCFQNSEQEQEFKCESVDSDQVPSEGLDIATIGKDIESMDVESDRSSKKKKKKSKQSEKSDETQETESSTHEESVSKKSKGSLEVSESAAKSSNYSSTNDVSHTRSASRKAKLLAMLADDSDESDCDDSANNTKTNAEANSPPRGYSSIFKGSNFEKIPGYNPIRGS